MRDGYFDVNVERGKVVMNSHTFFFEFFFSWYLLFRGFTRYQQHPHTVRFIMLLEKRRPFML